MDRIKVTSENINDLYDRVNKLIDGYFEWNIKPSSLKRYLKKGSIGIKKFIDRNGLGDIDRIEKIILDVVEDRNGMEQDGVITFEKFNSVFVEEGPNEIREDGHDSILYKDLEESGIEHEKILADHFRTSLGHINPLDSDKHIYEISERNNMMEVIIFSKEDLSVILRNLNLFVYNALKESKIKMKSINLEIDISDIIGNDEELEIKLGLSDNLIETISEILINEDFHYIGDYKEYHMWSK